MKKVNRSVLWLGGLVAVVALLVGQTGLSQADDDNASLVQQSPFELAVAEQVEEPEWVSAEVEALLTTLPKQPTIAFEAMAPTNAPTAVEGTEATCYQLLANPTLDIVEFGDGTGSAEPWTVLEQNLYYDSTFYTSMSHSLLMADGDETDVLDPDEDDVDAFGQGFFMLEDLEGVFVEYSTAVVDADSFDEVFGVLWSLDEEGFLDEVIASWEVTQPTNESEWQGRIVEITDEDLLAEMDGKVMAMTFYAFGDQLAPSQITYFDDVTVVACITEEVTEDLYLPSVINQVSTEPICIPPNETPQDQYNAHRGVVQTGARCESNLSRLDQADYYTFQPSKTGAHTLQLRNLPAGTEWSAMIFVDQPSPDFAPGPDLTGGQCRIATPGSGNKQVTCTLNKNQTYFVKVSAGGAYDGPVDSYLMRIMTP